MATEDIIRVQGQYYIRASASLAETRSHVLKHGDCFAVFDRLGNMRPLGIRDHGLFRDGTRFLSRLVLDLEGTQLLLLSSEVRGDKDILAVDMTNPEMTTSAGQFIGQDTIHILRTIFLWDNVYYERVRVRNYGAGPVRLPITLRFEADFVDIFEVRGMTRSERGEYLSSRIAGDTVLLRYRGLDQIDRETQVHVTPTPSDLTTNHAVWWVDLEPQAEHDIFLTVACHYPQQPEPLLSYAEALPQAKLWQQRLHAGAARIESANTQFNDWLNASQDDLLMMLTGTPHGLYPYAGVPWFSTVFGRDAIITALATLWWYPDIARGVLRYLAAYQATTVDPAHDAKPGKILHEQRRGEMANTGEIPFGCYYGSIDATPLFVVLAGRFYQRTGDRQFLEQLWPAVTAALHWIDTYGDRDGDGFVEYVCEAHRGLRNQGWKDSDDSIFYQDGTLAEPPLALCEVQGYVYEAKVLAAQMAEVLGHSEQARALRQQADTLRERFQQAFWCDDLGTYALALDGDKQPCRVRSSNAGHCLFSGLAEPRHAAQIAAQMVQPEFFTGWGIRTIPEGAGRYNPMSYHNGSVWPHDNALIAYGLSRYGYKAEAAQVLSGLFDASLFMDLRRLPELFCGFTRRQREGPTLYPVACLPQAWASASLFMLLQACLGLEIDGIAGRVRLTNPLLPAWLPRLIIHGLQVGDGTVDIAFYRHEHDVDINVLQREGEIEVVVTK
ncbi:MAG: glycogen debranching N-terminal domain-containing protein [Chloroflexaceae bacterium]